MKYEYNVRILNSQLRVHWSPFLVWLGWIWNWSTRWRRDVSRTFPALLYHLFVEYTTKCDSWHAVVSTCQSKFKIFLHTLECFHQFGWLWDMWKEVRSIFSILSKIQEKCGKPIIATFDAEPGFVNERTTFLNLQLADKCTK